MGLAKFRKKIKTKLLARLLAGNNVNCNICNSSYSSFLPYLNRANALCPNCGSLERTRLVYYFITKLGLLKNINTKLLHIAPEASLFHIFSEKLGTNYTPADKFEDIYSYPRGTQYIDVTELPLEENSTDMVICIHVLEHIQDDQKAIAEIYRVLNPGGVAILQVPFEADRPVTYEDNNITTPEERRKHFGQFDHVRIYGKDFLERFLAPGFKIEHENFATTIPVNIKEQHVFKNQDIFLLRK